MDVLKNLVDLDVLAICLLHQFLHLVLEPLRRRNYGRIKPLKCLGGILRLVARLITVAIHHFTYVLALNQLVETGQHKIDIISHLSQGGFCEVQQDGQPVTLKGLFNTFDLSSLTKSPQCCAKAARSLVLVRNIEC